ncbi:hypothetical protein DSM104299_01149 [Baekduia alba]|uniref:type I restriction endonuclease subunit R n=1 Tax=Baekduia alba TaxID=2997333 RepID=UPI002340CF28|nr:HsdR family type I site-specific deoxyribonuclease [Baekduia alba]WCB92453.1 hypothetical protein DSM104299_01149 [Baekduia alba]
MSATFHTTEADIQAEQLDVLQRLEWDFINRCDMNALRGKARMNEAIVEPLLIQALCKLNAGLNEDAAREIAAKVRRISSDREMLEVLRNGYQYKPTPASPTLDITVVDSQQPSRNDYVVTEEFVIRTGGQREPRLDVVCLVNGIPLGVIENKDTDEPISGAADDWRGYWLDAPQLITQTSVVGCCNGLSFRLGPSGLEDERSYLQWTDAWPREVEDPDDEMLVALTGAYHPHNLVDLATNFVVFETREGVTTKKLARAHQFRAANKLVDRVIAKQFDRGIIWHATGSGKSLTMVFAAGKLLRVGLGNPSVVLVIDRVDLDEQINETLVACEFDGVQQATSGERLATLLVGGGGVIVTTVQKFRQSMNAALKDRDVIVFVDEAHRSQFGKFGIWMQDALPTARMFGFTGTPIEVDSHRSTRKVFSPELGDGKREAYLDRFGFDQAIADGATVPVVYEPRLAEWRITKTDLDAKVDVLAADLDEEARDELRAQASKESVVAKAPARVAAIAADVADQLATRFASNGFCGQLVGVDREACALLAAELAKYLQPQEFAVIMSRNKKDSARRVGQIDLRYWYPGEHWVRVHGAPTLGGADEGDTSEAADEADGFITATDRKAIKDFIRRFKSDSDPLKLLVVNGMLLTGFDAPSEQVMFLDRGLREHTLMQAIARTNRRYRDKDYGVILDYWGVFDELKDALSEFASDDLKGLVEPTEALIERFPRIIDEALTVVEPAANGSARKRMLRVVRLLTDHTDKAEDFERLFREAQGIYETLTPDRRLAPHLGRYGELLEIWAAWRRGTRRDRRTGDDLRHKTRQLVQAAVGMDRIGDDLPAFTIDADFLQALIEDKELTPEEKATDIEAAIVHEIKVRGQDDPLAKTLAERLAELRAKRLRAAQMTLDDLRGWEQLVADYKREQERGADLGLDEAGVLVHAVLLRSAPSADEQDTVDVAKAMSKHYDDASRIPDWKNRPDVAQRLRRAAVKELVVRDSTSQLPQNAELMDELMAALATLR